MKNREIKFRGLSEDGWVYGYYVKHGSAATIESPAGDRHNLVHVVKPETVGQYVGPLTLRREDVFEGDYIHGETQDRHGIVVHYGSVVWSNDAVGFVMNDEDGNEIRLSQLHRIGIRGNIHEGVNK